MKRNDIFDVFFFFSSKAQLRKRFRVFTALLRNAVF